MPKTVLVVDDDPDFVEMIDAVLTQEGYRVVSCLVPTEACQKARQLQPDVVIIDLLMPGCSGWQVMEQLKADPSTAGIPLIISTAAVSEATQQVARLRQWGCKVLPKPFELSDLIEMLAKATARRKCGNGP